MSLPEAAEPGVHLTGRLHGAVLLKPVVNAAKLFLPVAFVLAFGDSSMDWIMVGYIVTVGIQVAISLARFSTFNYVVTDEMLTMRWGLVTHRTRTIPLGRIINTTTRRELWHRIFGAEEVRFETAGGSEEDAVIEALSRARSHEIRAVIREARQKQVPAPGDPKQDDIVSRLTIGDTMLHGMTSNVLAALGFIVGIALENMDSFEFMGFELEDWMTEASTYKIAAGGASLLILLWMGSVVVSLVRFWGFTLRRSESGDLTTRFGLITVHAGRIHTGKVQALVIRESLFRRPFRLATVKALSAGSTAVEQPSALTEILLPILRFKEVGTLVTAVFPEFGQWPTLDRVHPLAIRRNTARVSIIPVLAILLAAWQWNPLAIWLLPVWLVAALILARKSYKNTGYKLHGDFLIVRRGVLSRITHIIPKARLQTMTLGRTLLDRRLGLSSLSLDTAARTAVRAPRIPDITPDEARVIRAECLAGI